MFSAPCSCRFVRETIVRRAGPISARTTDTFPTSRIATQRPSRRLIVAAAEMRIACNASSMPGVGALHHAAHRRTLAVPRGRRR